MSIYFPPFTASLVRPVRAIATKNGSLGGNSGTNVSNGTDTSETSRLMHRTPAYQVSDLRVKFNNWRLFSTGETTGANDITVKASIEYNGTSYPLYFNGQRSITINSGGSVMSDPLSLTLPANATFFSRTLVTVAAAGVWPKSRFTQGGASGEARKANSDQVDATGAITTPDAGTVVFGPSAIVGISESFAPTIAVIGDSISAGQGDANGDADGNVGFLERALSNNVAWISSTRSSTQIADFIALHSRRLSDVVPYCTSAIVQLGVNDFYTAHVSLATAQANLTAAVALLAKRGMKVFATTITPRTNSTDSWATVTNQTVSNSADNAARTAYNDWLRQNWQSIGLAGYFEIADVVESARNSGLWKATGSANGYTADGLHPNATMAALMAQAVNTSRLV